MSSQGLGDRVFAASPCQRLGEVACETNIYGYLGKLLIYRGHCRDFWLLPLIDKNLLCWTKPLSSFLDIISITTRMLNLISINPVSFVWPFIKNIKVMMTTNYASKHWYWTLCIYMIMTVVLMLQNVVEKLLKNCLLFVMLWSCPWGISWFYSMSTR